MDLEFENILNVNSDLQEQVRIWRNNININKFMLTNHHINKEEHSRWINKLKKQDNAKAWIIKYNKKPVGLIQLSNIDYKNKITEWGFYIADESVRGKGVGNASLNKLICYVFEEMKFNKMKTFVLENNTVAIKLYDKYGFEKVGKLEEKIQRFGKNIDVYLMSLSKKKWETIKKLI